MLKVMPITGTLAALFFVASGASAQVTSRPDSGNAGTWPTQPGRTTTTTSTPTYGGVTSYGDVTQDSSFIHQTVRGNYTEVELGRLATSRSSNSQVKEFAERMVNDHNSMNKQWVGLAQKNDMNIKVDLGPAGQQSVDRLKGLSGSTFDQAYISEMIREHEQDLAALQRMSTAARSSEVRQLSSSGAAAVREHLTLAQQVGREVGVSSTAGRVGGVPAPTTSSTTTEDRNRTANEGNHAENRSSLSGADRAFVDNVLRDHLMHVRLAKQAEHQGSTEVKDLAQRIQKDFTQWSGRWESYADRREAEVSSKLSPHNKEKLERLNKANGKEFDRAYADLVADHLELMMQDFRAAGERTQASGVQRLAKEELPVLRDLLSRAQKLDREESSDTK